MKEASWNDCIESNNAVKISIDTQRALSLIETADGRISVSMTEINKDNANYVFESYYSSVLEYLQAVVILRGYKVTNHICLGYYLRDVLKKHYLFIVFDDCRYKRDALICYGKKMEFETAQEAIEKAKLLIKEFKKIVNEET